MSPLEFVEIVEWGRIVWGGDHACVGCNARASAATRAFETLKLPDGPPPGVHEPGCSWVEVRDALRVPRS